MQCKYIITHTHKHTHLHKQTYTHLNIYTSIMAHISKKYGGDKTQNFEYIEGAWALYVRLTYNLLKRGGITF